VKRRWTIHLAAAAERDFQEILRWTVANFGPRQAKAYSRTLSSALHNLALGPSIPGARLREDIGPGIHTLHVARKGRKGRHFVVFRVAAPNSSEVIDVLRLLHDSMDLPHHVAAANETGISGDPQH
jgi:toxin ParE1/3/4